MNITKENTGELTAVIKIEIIPEDYNAAVEKVMHDYKRKANIPGFRPGHVPVGLIKKMYGKAILADEVNKLLNDRLMAYIKDEKLEILGNPLPSAEKNSTIDFETQTSFDFYFDLGFAPSFTVPFSTDLEIPYYSINVDDGMIDKYVEDTRKRFGTSVPSVDPEKEIEEEKKETEMVPAEMNSGFYNKVYPGLSLETEEDFRDQVRKDAISSFVSETDKLFFHNVTETLINKTEIRLPDDFLKRWLQENNEGKYTQEEIEKDYPSFAESMKWQLIENKLIRDFNITIRDEDIRDYIRTYLLRQINQQNTDPEVQKKYDTIVDAFMQNKEQVQRINDQLYNARLLDLFKNNLGMKPTEVSYEEFIKLVSAVQPHEHVHRHDHEHKDEDEADHDHQIEQQH